MANNNKKDSVYYRVFGFLGDMRWPIEPLSKRSLRTYFNGEFGLCPVSIYLNAQDVCMAICPLVSRPGDRWGEAVVDMVEAMSREIRHVGLGIDSDGDLFVRVSLPAEHLDAERFQCILVSMCQVAENLLIPILQADAYDRLNSD